MQEEFGGSEVGTVLQQRSKEKHLLFEFPGHQRQRMVFIKHLIALGDTPDSK